MGASFSSFEKHGGCYNFGLTSRANRKDTDDGRSEAAPVCVSLSTCDPCQSIVLPYSDSCCSHPVLRSTCHCQSLPAQADPIRSTQSSVHRIITTETQVGAFSQQEQQNSQVQQQRHLGQQFHPGLQTHPTVCRAVDDLGMSYQAQQHQTLQHCFVSQTPTQGHPLEATGPVPRDLISLTSSTHIFVTEPELRLLMKSGLLPSCRTISNRFSILDDQAGCHKMSVLSEQLRNLTSINESKNLYLDSLRDLIRSWSYEELFRVYLRFEALTKIHVVVVDAINARPRAPTLEEDLRSLCSNFWCCNLQLAYQGAMHRAHSYILAYRSKLFADVLSTLYSLHTGHSQTSAIAPNLTIVIPGCHDARSPSVTTDSAKPIPVEPPKHSDASPDLVPSVAESGWHLKRVQPTDSSGTQTKTTVFTKSVHSNVRPKSEQGEKFHAFLQDIYCGSKRSDLATEQHTHCSPRKSKPDLLCGSVLSIHPSSLLGLYEELSRYDSSAINFLGPLAPDCKVIFTSSAAQLATPMTFQMLCHAGVLAARSQFLRRLLIRRYQVGPAPGKLTTIVLDGSLVQPYFGQTLLHFFYTDQLPLNRLACSIPVPNQCTGGGGQQNMPDANVRSTCNLVFETHLLWHRTHRHCPTVSCCQDDPEGDSSTDQWHSELSGAQPTMMRGNAHQLSTIRFCLACPFCMALVLELHPVGQYLEFPRLTEVCEDVVVQALRLPYQEAAATGNKEQTLRSCGHCFSSAHCTCTTSTPVTEQHSSHHHRHRSQRQQKGQRQREQQQQRMTPVSLAVGLIRWADAASSARLSRTLSSSDSLDECDEPRPPGSIDTRPEGPMATVSDSVEHNDTRSDSHRTRLHCDGLAASTTPTSQTYLDDRATTRYLHRQAMHCLRQYFMLLVRSPSVLCRLSAKQLDELLDSDFVQAPECEILAALLCWAELRLELERGHGPLGDRRKSTDSSSNPDPGPMSYMSLVSSLAEQSWLPCDHGEHQYPRCNPWLLLSMQTKMRCTGTSRTSVDLIPNTSGDFSATGDIIVGSTDKTSSNSWKPRTDHIRSSKCDLCNLAAAVHGTPQPMDQLASHNLGFGPVDIDELVRKLHRHGLLDHLRPAYMLNAIPLGLAALILQYQLGTSAGAFSDPLCKQRLGSSLSFGLNHSGVPSSDIQTALSLSDGGAPSRKSARFARWFPLLTTSMRLLRPTADQVNEQEASSLSVHPLLGMKIGTGPLASCPACSPAQLCAHTVWTRLEADQQSSTNSVLPCDCHWALQDMKGMAQVNRDEAFWTSISGSAALLDAVSPRLYAPFMDEIRATLISKAPVPFSRSELDVLRFTSDANPPDQPRCTCVHLLSTLVGHITPTPMDVDSWAASLGVWRLNSTDVKDFSEPVSTDAKNRSPSKAPNDETSTRVGLTVPQFGHDVRSCCQNQCKEFADCLLNTSQWVALLTRYVDLVNKFIAQNLSASVFVRNRQLARLLRLHALREQGLPDSLDLLFACRINEHFLLMRPTTSSRTVSESSQTIPTGSSESVKCWSVSNLPRSGEMNKEQLKANDQALQTGSFPPLLSLTEWKNSSAAVATVQERCILCPISLGSNAIPVANTATTTNSILPIVPQSVACTVCEAMDNVAAIHGSKSSVSFVTENSLEVPDLGTHPTSAANQRRNTSFFRDFREVAHPTPSTLIVPHAVSVPPWKSSSTRTMSGPLVSCAAVNYPHSDVFHTTIHHSLSERRSTRLNKFKEAPNATNHNNKKKRKFLQARPLSAGGIRDTNIVSATRSQIAKNRYTTDFDCAYCTQLAQCATPGLDPCAISLAVLSDEEVDELVLSTDRRHLQKDASQLLHGTIPRSYWTTTMASYYQPQENSDHYYYYHTTGSYHCQQVPVTQKEPRSRVPDSDSQLLFEEAGNQDTVHTHKHATLSCYSNGRISQSRLTYRPPPL